MSTYRDEPMPHEVEWPDPQEDPEEEPAESLEDDGTPGAVPPKEEPRGPAT